MHFVIRAIDKPGSLQIRMDNRGDHVAFLKAHGDQIVAAGPLLSEPDGDMCGSLLIMSFADLDAAETFTREDPYAKAGLFANVDISPWKKVFPAD